MVLQQGTPVRVWGWAEPGEAITVAIAGQNAGARAGVDGRWNVRLDALDAGGPYEMTVSGARDRIVLNDVLAGEVWVCSGQSNMEMGVELVDNADAEIRDANQPLIRLFTVPKKIAMEPQEDVVGQWYPCTPENIRRGEWAGFSAAAYFFGKELARNLKTPIGLVHSSWGGTVAEAWTSRDGLLGVEALRPFVERLDESAKQPSMYLQSLRDFEAKLFGDGDRNIGLEQGWPNPITDTSTWPKMQLPSTWQAAGLGFSGVLWFRKEVELPRNWAGQDLKLHIGACDKNDITYFNGERVGALSYMDQLDSWQAPREYDVPGRLVNGGVNTIAVRVSSYAYDGGMRGPEDQMFIEPAGVHDNPSISLSGAWHYNVEKNIGFVDTSTIPQPPYGEENPNSPTVLFNGMIAPLLNFAIRGAIWYQGESNSSRAEQYRTLFPSMIRDWRRNFAQGDFPFYFVQLANFIPGGAEVDCWAFLREAQLLTLNEPNTGMAVAADIGLPADVHPTNKQEVGRRLALNALAQAYGDKDLVYSGPIFRSAKVEGSAVRLFFDHVASGLRAHGSLTGFVIAGDDGEFVAADACLDGESVLVSSPAVRKPRSVRYAWADNPDCSLYNSAGLPASPFRTDMPSFPLASL
ncbi:MAG: sialate O-acetylesterase [Capsulimonadaceae bacterium]|nr:sialate O-acetylesterase [Capsulimonadaceae bacterium]